MNDPKVPSIWEPVVALVVLAAALAVFLSRHIGAFLNVVVVVLALGVCGGCASPGAPLRFAVLDLDFRTPDQIRAGQVADCAPFQEPAAAAAVNTEKALPLTWWQALFAMVSDLEARLRVVAIERGRVEVLAK